MYRNIITEFKQEHETINNENISIPIFGLSPQQRRINLIQHRPTNLKC
jgi:hypothetical protein